MVNECSKCSVFSHICFDGLENALVERGRKEEKAFLVRASRSKVAFLVTRLDVVGCSGDVTRMTKESHTRIVDCDPL